MNTLNTTSFTAFIGIDWADASMIFVFRVPMVMNESLMLYRTR